MKKRVWVSILLVLILAVTGIACVHAEVIQALGQGQVGYQAVVLCETLTLRKSPSTGAAAVRTLEYGDQIIVTKEKDGWAQCCLSDSLDAGPEGWVKSDYIVINPSWYRADAGTTVYAWDDTNAPKVGLLEKGTLLPILKMDDDWLIVSLRGAVGFVRNR